MAKRIEQLSAAYPDAEIKLIDTAVVYTLGVYDSTMKTMIEGAVLAILVVLVFLRDLRARYPEINSYSGAPPTAWMWSTFPKATRRPNVANS